MLTLHKIIVIFQLRGKLLRNTAADGNNGILKNAIIAVPLKYLSNFWISLQMPLINCKIKLKLKWKKNCVLSAAGADNANPNSNNIIFTIKDIKFYAPVVTLSAKDNQKLSKFVSKGSERSVYWNEYQTKGQNENTTNGYGYCLESNFVEVTDCLC